MNRVLVLAFVAGCGPKTLLVRDVQIDGYDLVVEKCPISNSGWYDWNGFRSCTTERMPLPVRTITGARQDTNPDRAQTYRLLGHKRAEIAACATGSPGIV